MQLGKKFNKNPGKTAPSSSSKWARYPATLVPAAPPAFEGKNGMKFEGRNLPGAQKKNKGLPTVLSSSLPFVHPFLKKCLKRWMNNNPSNVPKKPSLFMQNRPGKTSSHIFFVVRSRKFQRSSLRGKNVEISVMFTPQKSPKHVVFFIDTVDN